MSGPVAIMTPRTDVTARAGQGEARAAPSWWDAAGASWRLSQDDSTDYQVLRRANAFDELERQLVAMGRPKTRYHNPAWSRPLFAWDKDPREEQLWADVVEARRASGGKAFADIPAQTRQEFTTWAARRKGGRDADQAAAARGGFGSSLLPGLAFGLAHAAEPENLLQIPLGGGGKTLAGTLLRQFGAGVVGTVATTGERVRARGAMGETYSGDDLAYDALLGGAANAGFVAGHVVAGKAGSIAYDAAGRPLVDALARAGQVFSDFQYAQALKKAVPPELRSPDLQAALNVVERAAEIDETSPFTRTYEGLDQHVRQLETAMHTLETLPVAEPSRFVAGSPPPSAPAGGGGGFNSDAALSFILDLEGGAQLVTDSGGLTKYGISQNANPGVDIANLTEAGARAIYRAKYLAPLNLKGRSAEVSLVALDASVNHGPGFAQQLLAAAGDDPARMIALRRAEYARLVAADPAKYGRYAEGWENRLQRIEERIGLRPGEAGAAAAPGDLEPVALIRPDALDTVRPLVTIAGAQLELRQLRPGGIEVDAPLMQFKSESDAFGVTDRLRGVTRWDPLSAGNVTVWERADGTQFIADGHQRLGLAKRIMAADPAQDIRLNAWVLREADGVTAAAARAMTALANLRQGSGKPVDAAKVFREIGIDEDLIASLPSRGPEGAVIRDGRALADLSQEAFGAVVNDVISERYGAVIGRLARDTPDRHMALVELLAELEPANTHQAESIVSQALEAGFIKENQAELFGSREVTSALFLQRAKVLDRTLAELSKLKGAFGVAARNADALTAAGNRIDVGASEAAAAANAQALALVDQLALRRGNVVNDIVNRAAERLANGEPLASVVRDVVAELRDVDLARAVSDAGGGGRPAGDGGYQRDLDGEAGSAPDPDAPATLDELEAAGQSGFALFDAETHRAFDDPAGAGVQAAADSTWHDIRAANDTGAGDAPLADIGARLEQAIAADPAAARAAYAALPDSDDGRILNTDLARELSPEYQADRSRSAEVHEAASTFIKQLYTEKPAAPDPRGEDPLVLFTGGGTGAGKSTGLAMMGAKATGAEIIYDTNMNSLASAIGKIDQALATDRRVSILYTWRDPIEALVKGGLPRAERMGRTVPLDKHIETHVGARETIDALKQHYAGNDRVEIIVIDNSHGKNNARFVDLENLPRIDEVGLHDKALAETVAAYDQGHIGWSTLRGTVGERAEALRRGTPAPEPSRRRGDPRQSQPQYGGARPLDAADLVDLDDGRGPRSIADIEAELKRAEDDIGTIEGCL